jgi:hypothetical protein
MRVLLVLVALLSAGCGEHEQGDCIMISPTVAMAWGVLVH